MFIYIIHIFILLLRNTYSPISIDPPTSVVVVVIKVFTTYSSIPSLSFANVHRLLTTPFSIISAAATASFAARFRIVAIFWPASSS